MYEVSAEYLSAMQLPAHKKIIRGTIGTVSFSENNISSGTLVTHNQCSESSEVKLGAVYIGTLECTFLKNIGIDRYSWKGKEISVEEGLLVGSTYEYVPKGIWTITEAKWSKDGISVQAYDNMQKFDRPFPYTIIPASTPIDILQMFCDDCHVENGMESLEEFCNGSSILSMTEPGDIKTYKDALFWFGQALCAFSTIDRTGKLVLRRFVSDPVDVVQSVSRYDDSSFSDYSTKYTSVSIVNMSDSTTKYYAAEVDDGSTINLGSNPFLQAIGAEQLIENILTEIQLICYVPFSASLLDGAPYDLGDVIDHRSGNAGQSSRCMIMYFDDFYNKRYEMMGFGSNPALASAQSKSDKSIQGLLSSVNKNEYQDYEIKNTGRVLIGDGEEKRIVSVKLASNNSTKAMIHIQIILESKANDFVDTVPLDIEVNQEEPEEGDEEGEITASGTVSGDDIFRLISEKTTKGIVRYIVQSEEVSLKPQEEWIDGNHILHLMYIQPLEAGIPLQFDVYLKAKDGDIVIPRGGIWFYGSGRGLVGDGKWDGTLKFNEETADFDLIELEFETSTGTVTISTQAPTGITVADNTADFDLIQLTFETATESVEVTFHNDMEPRITEDGEERITEDGEALYTEGD